MAGEGLALTPRDRELLEEVQRHQALTRDHVLRMQLFTSKTRANERLRRLTIAGYLMSKRQPLCSGGPRAVYFPGRLLKHHTGGSRRLSEASDLFLNHHLGLVDIRLAFAHSTTITRWQSDWELSGLSLGLVPDAYLEFEHQERSYSAFVEYDRGTEALKRLEQKTKSYLDLAFSGRFERVFQRRFFRALYITDSPLRLANINKAVERLTNQVVRLTTLKQLLDEGPVASIWYCPGSRNSPESLTVDS